ncbi:APC family permease [Nocardia heshunensis]
MTRRTSALDRAIADPPSVLGVSDTSPMSGLRRRSLGFADVLAQSVSAIAPGAAAATTPGLLVGVAGDGALWAAIAGAALTLPVAAAVNQFTKRVSTAGSLYTFTAKGLGPRGALLSGVGLILGYAFIAMYALANIGPHVGNVLAALGFGAAAGPLLPPLCVLGAGLLCAVVMVRGVRVSARLSLLVESVAVAVLLALISVLWWGQGRVVAPELLAPAHVPFTGFVVGVVIAITAFVGFESAASLSVEARRPFATVPRVLVWSPIATGVLVVAATSVQATGFRLAGLGSGTDPVPVDALSAYNRVGWISPILDCGVTASFFACALASATALVRVLLSMGIDGVLPEALSRTHPAWRTPHVAIGVSMPIVVLVPLLILAAGTGVERTAGVLLVVSAGGYVLAYLLVCLAVPLFLWRIGELTPGPVTLALAAAGGLSGCLTVFLTTEWSGPHAAGVWAFLAALATGTVVFARLRRSRLPDIGTHDIPIGSEVLGGAEAAAGRGR